MPERKKERDLGTKKNKCRILRKEHIIIELWYQYEYSLLNY